MKEGVALLRLYFFPFVRILIGAVFLTSGILKLIDLREFFKIIESFGFGLGPHNDIIGVLLVAGEILGGILMILGLQVKVASVILMGLLIFFIAVIISQLAMGNEITCGCFGALSQGK
ncbi:MAG: DoxX family protein [Ignavibacteriales bacterium]|nr:DoxX family protein [Ignavibacteriales bacterium]